MSETMLARHKSARDLKPNEEEGLLEGATGLGIDNQGLLVAVLHDLVQQAGTFKLPQIPGWIVFRGKHDSVEIRIFACKRLVWTHAGAMRILQGVSVSAVLGPTWLVLAGRPTLPGDPSPGFRAPVLADVVSNPAKRTQEELFQLIRRGIGLAC